MPGYGMESNGCYSAYGYDRPLGTQEEGDEEVGTTEDDEQPEQKPTTSGVAKKCSRGGSHKKAKSRTATSLVYRRVGGSEQRHLAQQLGVESP